SGILEFLAAILSRAGIPFAPGHGDHANIARNESARRRSATMSLSQHQPSASEILSFTPFASAVEYMVDAAQRTVLFWDVMRQRGLQYREHLEEAAPHVLNYEVELVVDGRKLDRPVNYGLARIIPPRGIELDPALRPFVIVDPRAGHGPGIGGVQGRSGGWGGVQTRGPGSLLGLPPQPPPPPRRQGHAARATPFFRKC